MYKEFTDKTPATTAAAPEEKMAHLAQEELVECRETARTEILAVTAQKIRDAKGMCSYAHATLTVGTCPQKKSLESCYQDATILVNWTTSL